MANKFPDEIEKLLSEARIPLETLKPLYYEIKIGTSFPDESTRLLEANNQILNELDTAKRLILRGTADDFAVLCTTDGTFELKSAETSNTILLANQIKENKNEDENKENGCVNLQVNSIVHSKFELIRCVPKLRRIRTLLEKNPYCGQFDDDENVTKITFDDLKNEIQASDKDITNYLKKLNVVTVDGSLRMLDFDYCTKLIEYLLSLISIKEWLFEEIPIVDAASEMNSICPKNIAKQAIQQMGSVSQDGRSINLDKVAICKHYALDLLKNLEKMKLDEFMTCWSECVPDGFVVNIDQLKGLVIITDNTITYTDADLLSENVDERFKTLFSKKDVWSLDELEPFLINLTTSTNEFNSLLFTHTRSYIKNGKKFFVPKYPNTN
ncbi:unnamed protein product [Didymodactylos carnosus]|uniref:Sister chromatid cohesion protein DCC1 n=1 Tax=Didymodactylos carnosus TaxID=1234261 RepID=A0A813Y7E1_9BILA|nr:unnamed protein product [Didymodactylos carnosus]CAF0962481.1 unnamed protein product [Didymodactylos carnosus]CAF3666658.1 unnamed protein product [Didymodactylos carnosus]CAF3735127.1 unnamed protein product [Didymodactylos carnosus]